MSTYRIAATVLPNGLLELPDLPFQAGELVEVTVRPLPIKKDRSRRFSGSQQAEKSAISAIQGGKYAKVLPQGEPLASEEFAIQKQAEQANEERNWRI